MSSRSAWLWASLGFMAFGVPLIACGGQVLSGATDAGVAETGSPTHTGSSTGTTPTGSTTTTPPSSGTGTATSTPTGSGSSTGPGGFGPFPCTAYTAVYNACPPSSGSSPSPSTCQYWAQNGQIGLGTPPGEVAEPGCKMEIVPPTSAGGATCDHVDCLCTGGMWQKEPGASTFPCPQ